MHIVRDWRTGVTSGLAKGDYSPSVHAEWLSRGRSAMEDGRTFRFWGRSPYMRPFLFLEGARPPAGLRAVWSKFRHDLEDGRAGLLIWAEHESGAAYRLHVGDGWFPFLESMAQG